MSFDLVVAITLSLMVIASLPIVVPAVILVPAFKAPVAVMNVDDVMLPVTANTVPSNVMLASPCMALAPVTVVIVLFVEPDSVVFPLASTYALIDCCVANAVSLFVPMASSSSMVVTTEPPVPNFKFSRLTLPDPEVWRYRSSFVLAANMALSSTTIAPTSKATFPFPVAEPNITDPVPCGLIKMF